MDCRSPAFIALPIEEPRPGPELINGRKARAQCIMDWYSAKGEDQFFGAANLAPQAFKARFGFDRDDETIAHIEVVLIRMANDACPK